MYALECPLCDVTVRNNTFYRARVTPIFKSKGLQMIPKGYRVVANTFFIDPGQDVAFRYSITDSEYREFYDRIASENCIVESAF